MRQAADTLPESEVARLRSKYGRLHKPTSTNPGSTWGQARIHFFYCGEEGSEYNIHNDIHFFLWHRWFLYFHERALGVSIPYWRGCHGASFEVPRAYESKELYPSPPDPDDYIERAEWRRPPGSAPTPEELITSLASTPDINAALSILSPWHNWVHAQFRRDAFRRSSVMATPVTAAADPLFYAFHAEVDRYFEFWLRASKFDEEADRKNKDIYNQRYILFDAPSEKWVCVRAGDALLIPHEYESLPSFRNDTRKTRLVITLLRPMSVPHSPDAAYQLVLRFPSGFEEVAGAMFTFGAHHKHSLQAASYQLSEKSVALLRGGQKPLVELRWNGHRKKLTENQHYRFKPREYPPMTL
ncbi:MAG: tyrosinase family protein [Bryobacteraceae bacterium]|nr:tyrosinase family protein [Bryobacteraceae bacterium]